MTKNKSEKGRKYITRTFQNFLVSIKKKDVLFAVLFVYS